MITIYLPTQKQEYINCDVMEKKSFSYKGGGVYYYHETGGNKSILLLHGYSFNSLVWDKMGLIQTLKDMNYNVFALDVPGFPKSINHFNLSDNDFAEFLNYFIKNVIGNAPVLMGSSASGYLALKFAESYSNRLRSVVVVAPVRLNSVELSRITIKILGMWGGNDNISDPKEGERLLKECRNAQVIILENAGHACYLDRPIEFNEAISNFLSDS